MGTKNNPGSFDCYNVAEPDEPMFVLLGRDPTAAFLVTMWWTLRQEMGGTAELKLHEARTCAHAMEKWALAKGKDIDAALRAFKTQIVRSQKEQSGQDQLIEEANLRAKDLLIYERDSLRTTVAQLERERDQWKHDASALMEVNKRVLASLDNYASLERTGTEHAEQIDGQCDPIGASQPEWTDFAAGWQDRYIENQVRFRAHAKARQSTGDEPSVIGGAAAHEMLAEFAIQDYLGWEELDLIERNKLADVAIAKRAAELRAPAKTTVGFFGGRKADLRTMFTAEDFSDDNQIPPGCEPDDHVKGEK